VGLVAAAAARVHPPTLRTLLSLARADLAAELTGAATPTQQLAHVVCLAVRLVPGTEHAGVSRLRAGQTVETLAATSSIATACDQAQRELGEGPLAQLGAARGSMRIDDLGAERRWPRFAARAGAVGVRSMLVCALSGTRGGTAMLSLYSSRRRGFSVAAELVAPVFASRAAVALAHAEQVRNLRRAIGTRQVIGEAVGILMERHGSPPGRPSIGWSAPPSTGTSNCVSSPPGSPRPARTRTPSSCSQPR